MKNQQHILVVDDEVAIAELVELYLQNEGFKVSTFNDSIAAFETLESTSYDLAILDVMMPKLDGFVFLQKMRQTLHIPVILLTARGADLDKINGLSLGADDYMTKPFQPLELVARVKAQLRRNNEYTGHTKTQFSTGGLVLNPQSREVILDEVAIDLTNLEYEILKLLLERQGEVVTVEDLYLSVWKDKYYENASNTVMVHIRRLREKLGDTGDTKKYIKTVWGVGYKCGS